MPPAPNRLSSRKYSHRKNALWAKLRGTAGRRFTRFVPAALAALAASELTLGVCDGVFHSTAGVAAVTGWFAGAVVSYVLSRWAWERKGKPNVMRETVPFWVISVLVVVLLTLATKLGYSLARSMGLHGWEHVAFVGMVYLAANSITFVMRFLIFHYVLFADPRGEARAATTGPATATPLDASTPPDAAPSPKERAGRSG